MRRGPPRQAALAVLLVAALLTGCGPDARTRLERVRPEEAGGLSLGEVMRGFPHFAKVTWSDYPGPRGSGRELARTQGHVDLKSLVGISDGRRVFSPRDLAVIEKAKASLVFALEYAFSSEAPQGLRTRMELRLSSMDWEQAADLADGAILREIASGRAGPALAKAALDAADFCRAQEKTPVTPPMNR